MRKHAKLPGQFSPEAHFSKMIHVEKKSISLSLDELSVLSVGFTRKQLGGGRGEEERALSIMHVHGQMRVHTHTHDHASHHCRFLARSGIRSCT